LRCSSCVSTRSLQYKYWTSCIMADHDVSKVAENGLQWYRELAGKWSRIYSSLPACSKAPYAEFVTAAQRLSAVNHGTTVHNSFRINFQTRLKHTSSILKVSATNPSNPQICKVRTLKFCIRKLAPDHVEFAKNPCHTRICCHQVS